MSSHRRSGSVFASAERVSPPARRPGAQEALKRVSQRSGAPLEAPVRVEMEKQFGFDFSGVRVHADHDTGRATDRCGAQAWTLGDHVGFATDQYRPFTERGAALLAHELSHVVQTAEGRDASSAGSEREADRAPRVPSPMQRAPGRGAEPRLAFKDDEILTFRLDQSMGRAQIWLSSGAVLTLRITESHLEPGEYQAQWNAAEGRLEIAPWFDTGLLFTLDADDETLGRYEAMVVRLDAPVPFWVSGEASSAGAESEGGEAAEIAAARAQLEEDEALLNQPIPFLRLLFPEHTRHIYRDPTERIHDPMLRQHSRMKHEAATAGGRFYRDAALLGVGSFTASLAVGLLLAGGFVVAAEAGAVSGAVALVGQELSLAGGALVSLSQSALSFYLSNAILVNELGLLGVGTLLAVEGDVGGLLRMMDEDPAQAALLLMEIWYIRAIVRVGGPGTTPRDKKVILRATMRPPRQGDTKIVLDIQSVEAANNNDWFEPTPQRKAAGEYQPLDDRMSPRASTTGGGGGGEKKGPSSPSGSVSTGRSTSSKGSLSSGRGPGPVAKSPREVVHTVADSEFRIMNCVRCADQIVKSLQRAGIAGRRIHVQAYVPGTERRAVTNIYSDRAGKNISENGVHEAVEVDGIVYDNMNRDGLPRSQWQGDLYSPFELRFTEEAF